MWVHHDLFFATRIRINVSWSGSGSGQMIRIQPDPIPEPKHCEKGPGSKQKTIKYPPPSPARPYLRI